MPVPVVAVKPPRRGCERTEPRCHLDSGAQRWVVCSTSDQGSLVSAPVRSPQIVRRTFAFGPREATPTAENLHAGSPLPTLVNAGKQAGPVLGQPDDDADMQKPTGQSSST